jgi:hypothetical protein
MTVVKKLAKRLKPRLKKIRKRDIMGYVKELEQFLRETFMPRLNARNLHTARKRMKQIVYLTSLTDRLPKEERKFYSRLESAIGLLHDKETLLEFLKAMPRGIAAAQKTLLRKQIASERKAIAMQAKAFYGK